MIADFAGGQLLAGGRARRIRLVTEPSRSRLPWLLVASSVLLALLLVYTFLGGYLPARRRVAGLEHELRGLYGREAELQTRIAQNEQHLALREQRLLSVTAERDALARRLEEAERQLAAARGQKR